MRWCSIRVSVFLASALCTTAVSAAGAERVSSIADQERVSVTIYNAGVALVHDRRRVRLEAGDNHVAWRDVSASMDATSAILSDLSRPGGANVVEQNFNYDLLQPSAVLAKYVGKQVVVVHPGSGVAARRETATLLSDTGGLVLQYADRVETDLNGGYLQFPAIPVDLRDRPTLVLDIASSQSAQSDLDLAYLTGGLSWQANYVGVVATDRRTMHLAGLVTLSNTSGTAYVNAHMQLVAGNVNVPSVPTPTTDSYAALADQAPPQFRQENYFEYHLYTLGRTTTIANNQTKQIALLSASGVPIHETLELRGAPDYYSTATPDLGEKISVGAYVTFANRGGELGVPLPGGVVRLYQNDSRGSSLFLGSDTIDHTPKNQDVRLHVGDAFDVTANKRQTDFHGVSDCIADSSYRIVLDNAKSAPRDVLVVEPIPGQWTIVSENRRHQKSSSSTATWTVRVPAGGSATLAYTARVKYCL